MPKNKLKKFAENYQMPHVIQPTFEEVFNKDYVLKNKWNQEEFKRMSPLILELGCGKGEYTVGLAENFPDKNFIGIDIKGARIWYGAKASLEKGLKNVRFLRTRIDFLKSFFARNEVDEIWLTFPDPQKEKERKRLTYDRFLMMYKEILKPGGKIHLKTDSDLLYEYTLNQIEKTGMRIYHNTPDLYADNQNSQLPVYLKSIQTHYEKMFLKENKTIKYLCFGW